MKDNTVPSKTPGSTELFAIERQLDKMDKTTGNLQMCAILADKEGHSEESERLSDQATLLRAQEFVLYQKKLAILVNSTKWTDLISAMDETNLSLGESLKDMRKLQETIDSATKLVGIATTLVKALG